MWNIKTNMILFSFSQGEVMIQYIRRNLSLKMSKTGYYF